MATVVGLKFEDSEAMFFYTPAQMTLAVGDAVVADTANGPRLARVVLGPTEMRGDQLPAALRPVARVATPEDEDHWAANRRLEARARAVTPQKIEDLDLPMRLAGIEAAFDGGRITVYFTAEGRVDFRELVRELSLALNVRVHMHQLGARDHARMMGGIGSCGRELCCATWMSSFEPVSMRMAKQQSLFLNPAKFSGACGKLKCCLRYEYDFYADAEPLMGADADTPRAWGMVTPVDPHDARAYADVSHEGRVDVKARLPVCPHGVDMAHAGCHACPGAATCGHAAETGAY